MRTRQEVFDIACKGLLTQMKKAEDAEEWEGLLKAFATKEGLVFNGRG